jgi:SAM-dependent methyltransferase
MKQAMDLFGQALYDRLNGETEAFYMDFYGDIDEHNLERYFRTIEELSLLEKRMIAESYGDILDIGCGTAHYFPLLNKQGKVVGIDISEKVIEVAHKMGNENCVVGDIFSLDENKQFDTITMFENNIGIGETLEGTKTMLSKISNLLKNTGQLLIQLTGRIQDKEYAEVELTPIYKNQR